MTHSRERLPNYSSLTSLIESMQGGRLDIVSREGQRVSIVDHIGGGGSKSIYDVNIGDRRYALALPNVVDDGETIRNKWMVVLREPANTERVRSTGLPVNTVCEIFPVQVNEIPFPALLMARYQDLPYEVRDVKNPNTSIWNTSILAGQPLDAQTFKNLFGGVLTDISTMIGNGVQVMRDSINLCIDRGQLRIFLNDLGSAAFERVLPQNLPYVAKIYTGWAVGALLNALHETEYQANKRFLEIQLDPDTAESFYTILSQEVLRNVG